MAETLLLLGALWNGRHGPELRGGSQPPERRARAVAFKLVGHTPKLMERVLKRREKLPMREPIGCRPPPPKWPEVPSRFRSQAEATATWKQLVTFMEE